MALPNGSADKGKNMADGKGGYRGGVDAALADFIDLVARRSSRASPRAWCWPCSPWASPPRPAPRQGPTTRGRARSFSGPARKEPSPGTQVETDVAIHVTGIVARTRVAQTFHNPGANPVEGLYVFPLPENAAIDRLWLRIGSRVIEGQ